MRTLFFIRLKKSFLNFILNVLNFTTMLVMMMIMLITVGYVRVTSSVTWGHLSALSISGLVVGACVLTCAVCCCCRRRRRRQRTRNSYQQHDLYDDDDAGDLCACAGCPSTSGLYACKCSFLADRTASQYDPLFVRYAAFANKPCVCIGIIMSSVPPSVCDAVHCGSQGRCTGLKVVPACS